MSTAELKNQVFKAVEDIEDNYILEGVLNLIKFEMDDKIIIEVSDEQKDAIDEARQQIEDGDFSTNKDFDKEIEEWLNK